MKHERKNDQCNGDALDAVCPGLVAGIPDDPTLGQLLKHYEQVNDEEHYNMLRSCHSC